MILDWLLAEVPADLLAKLEVYTFGNAANHFNNPWKVVDAQKKALDHPTSLALNTNGNSDSNGRRNEIRRGDVGTKKAIRYIEHYAHSSDLVARWGVLRFVCNYGHSPQAPRYMGRVFEFPASGHQFVQHYLDSMFPLEACEKSEEFPLGWKGAYEGDEDGGEGGNGFVDSRVEKGKDGDEGADEREGWEVSVLGARGGLDEEETTVRDMGSPIVGNGGGLLKKGGSSHEFEVQKGFAGFEGQEMSGVVGDGGVGKEVNGEGVEGEKERKEDGYRVKDLSRLWHYRNGKSPKPDEVDVGIARMSTI